MADEPEIVSEKELLLRIARELKAIRENLGKGLFAMHEAEAEVPEKMRRFTMYMSDLHHIGYIYEERGILVPQHIRAELERCDDRLRQLLERAHTDGGAFEKVRQEMAADPENRWDHTRQLAKPKEKSE